MAQPPFVSTSEIEVFVRENRIYNGGSGIQLVPSDFPIDLLNGDYLTPYTLPFIVARNRALRQTPQEWDAAGPFAGLLPDWYYE